jgi:hypothetical protein
MIDLRKLKKIAKEQQSLEEALEKKNFEQNLIEALPF